VVEKIEELKTDAQRRVCPMRNFRVLPDGEIGSEALPTTPDYKRSSRSESPFCTSWMRRDSTAADCRPPLDLVMVRRCPSSRDGIAFADQGISTPDVAKFVSTQLSRFVSPDWDLQCLQQYVRGCGKRLTIYVDAANEYCGPDGAFGLLDSVRAMINRGDGVNRLRVVVSCRAETWRLYEDEKGIKLFDSSRLFGGQPLILHGFDEPDQASKLFEKYSRFYRLRPTYTELSTAVKDLIRSPLMMSAVAETYSNPKGDAGASKLIPADLDDYYNVFRRLTRRKRQDARRLLNRNDPRRESTSTRQSTKPSCCFRGFFWSTDKCAGNRRPCVSSESYCRGQCVVALNPEPQPAVSRELEPAARKR
jgi:hypothetical protein